MLELEVSDGHSSKWNWIELLGNHVQYIHYIQRMVDSFPR